MAGVLRVGCSAQSSPNYRVFGLRVRCSLLQKVSSPSITLHRITAATAYNSSVPFSREFRPTKYMSAANRMSAPSQTSEESPSQSGPKLLVTSSITSRAHLSLPKQWALQRLLAFSFFAWILKK
eukprot:TRINITY_DN39317_c0_g1_i1.p1 TRINITY_DN39317_c0_g1~~TRINITY_DN39317_c0_g1_i1.p1  ORF type:complete len:124 (+),score=9.41 TRINITY_DN39317_c0_g1_i1:77-448(+)